MELIDLDKMSFEDKKRYIPMMKDSEMEYLKTILYLDNSCKNYTIRINKLYDALKRIEKVTDSDEIKRIANSAMKDDDYHCVND